MAVEQPTKADSFPSVDVSPQSTNLQFRHEVTNFAEALEETEVLHEELGWLRSRDAFLGHSEQPFSVALSGGGIRAAAFQAGVLWRLAEEGRLQDVEYLAAVSGGGYLAASLVSHLAAASERSPPSGASKDEVTSWYKSIVAKTICRMQRNAGGFVRDACAGLELRRPQDGSGMLPRIFDVPILILTLMATLATNPLQICIVWLVPVVECVNLFFGAALRAAFCNPTGVAPWEFLWQLSPFASWVRFFEIFAAANLVFWLLSRLPKSGTCCWAPRCYLLVTGGLACAVRCVAVTFLLISVLAFLPYLQEFSFKTLPSSHGNSTRHAVCEDYVRRAHFSDLVNCAEYSMSGQVWHEIGTWYDTISWEDLSVTTTVTTATTSEAYVHLADKMEIAGPDVWLLQVIQDLIFDSSRSLLVAFSVLILVMLLIGAILAPMFPRFFVGVLTIIGPVAALFVIFLLLQYRIYGPITAQPLVFENTNFTQARWDSFVGFSVLAGIVVVPFYNELRRLWHWYYLRTLQLNFFDRGKDISLPSLAQHPRCPLMILTGTATDFRRVEFGERLLVSHKTISEISFTSLHTGSHRTGFVRTPYFRTLGKCTALTGAGCLDAVSLSMSSRLRFRFWLEMLNLSWGDYILFSRENASHFVEKLAQRLRPEVSRKFRWIAQQAPVLCLWVIIQALLALGWHKANESQLFSQDCEQAKVMVLSALSLCTVVFGLSFFAFLPWLQGLMVSPVIRQVHQASRFVYRGEKAPGLLYVTDGGVQDCTAIVQLMRRQCKRILLVLAAADPQDELTVLKTAMAHAIDQQVGSFFDPSGKHRHVGAILNDYSEDKEMPYLHLGIRYGGWKRKDGVEELTAFGELFVVKNRLPDSFSNLQATPLITEEEVTGAIGPVVDFTDAIETGKLAKDLGGIGCCDCCHLGCNCGRKFPHLTGLNYLWLTPTLFGSLCRLGHEVSGGVVRAMGSAREEPRGTSTSSRRQSEI